MKACEVCGSTKGNICGKTGKHKMDLCNKHRKQMDKYGEISDIDKRYKPNKSIRTCEICGSTNGQITGKTGKFKMDLCSKHRDHMKRYGKIISGTRYDKNTIEIHGDYAEVILTNMQRDEVARAIIDTEDIDKVKDIRWNLSCFGYAVSKGKSMHRVIMGNPKGLEVDHIIHNTIDNRKGNLRICERYQNAQNRGLQSNNTSGYTGVSQISNGKWRATIKFKGKTTTLGHYKSIEDAAKARNDAVQSKFGEFAYKQEVV